MGSRARVELIPWDPESSQHIARLTEQRVQCGWHSDRVDAKWRHEQRAGSKCIFWIVLSPDDPTLDEKLQSHWALFPNEKEPLQDTGTTLRGVPRSPSLANMVPVGHISLDDDNLDATHLNLDLPTAGIFWIKTFYVSQAMRSTGVGRAAMDMVEAMATTEPLCATTLALDTVHRESQVRAYAADPRLGPVPKVSNQDWYTRRGYRVIQTVADYYKEPDGTPYGFGTVFMRRDLA